MNNILDQEDDQLKNDQRSKKSFRYFSFTMILVLILLLLTYFLSGTQPSDSIDIAYGILGLMLFGVSILGFKNAIQSLIAKEKWDAFKIIGLLGNLSTFGIIASVFFLSMLDLIRWYNGS